jgi:O-methyltransferase
MRQMVVKSVKGTLHRYGYDLVRSTGASSPDPALEFPVDFDEATIATVRSIQGLTMTGPERIYALCAAIRYLAANAIAGDIVECGVWRGGSMMAAARTLREAGDAGRELHLFDTYEGMPEPTEEDVDFAGVSLLDQWRGEHRNRFNRDARAGLAEVRENMRSVGYPMAKIHLIKGMVEDTIPRAAPDRIALLRLDTDYYESTRHEMTHLFPRLVPGGVLIIDDYGHFKGSKQAVDEYLAAHRVPILLQRIDYSARIGVKLG